VRQQSIYFKQCNQFGRQTLISAHNSKALLQQPKKKVAIFGDVLAADASQPLDVATVT
jgi:hypothetical protein